MGSGKSTLGRALAQTVPGCAFIDLDEEIERRAGMTIPQFFALRGEEAFRALEGETLRTLAVPAGADVCVVATGGGTPCRPGAMTWMNSNGTTVLLRASTPVLLRRLLEVQEQRPLLRGMAPEEVERFIGSEQRRREPFYSQARHTFPSDLLENSREIANSCNDFIDRFL